MPPESDFLSEAGASLEPPGEPAAAPPADKGREIPPGYVPHTVVGELRQQLRDMKSLLAEYQKFGDPKTLTEMKHRYEELAKSTTFTPSEKQRLQKELAEAHPEWASAINDWKTERQARQDYVTRQGLTKVQTWLESLGMEATQENNIYLQELVAGRIATDQDLLYRLKVLADVTAWEDAFADVKKRFGLGSLKRQQDAARAQAKALKPKPPASQDGGEKKPAAPASKDLRDVLQTGHDEAWRMLEAAGLSE